MCSAPNNNTLQKSADVYTSTPVAVIKIYAHTYNQSSMKNTQIEFRVEFTIKEGKLEEYKKLIHDMSRAVEANEPDTLTYEFYFNRDETKCIAHETYRNS
jgi:hypothetical protein